jgi:hypothetical protein
VQLSGRTLGLERTSPGFYPNIVIIIIIWCTERVDFRCSIVHIYAKRVTVKG